MMGIGHRITAGWRVWGGLAGFAMSLPYPILHPHIPSPFPPFP